MSAELSRDALEARIERDREELAETLDQIRERAREELDVRRRILERPTAWLVGAGLIGFWLGARR